MKSIFFILNILFVIKSRAQVETMYNSFHYSDISFSAISPDDSKILTGSNDGTFIIRDLRSGLLLRKKNLPENYILSASYSPDGSMLMMLNHFHSRIYILDALSGELLSTINIRQQSHVFRWLDSNILISGPHFTGIYHARTAERLFSWTGTEDCGLIYPFIEKKSGRHNFNTYSSCSLSNLICSNRLGLMLLNMKIYRADTQISCVIVYELRNFKELFRKYEEEASSFHFSDSSFITRNGKVFHSRSGSLLATVDRWNISQHFRFPADSMLLEVTQRPIVRHCWTGDTFCSVSGLYFDSDCSYGGSAYTISDEKLYCSDADTLKIYNWKTCELLKTYQDSVWCIQFNLSLSGKLLTNHYGTHSKVWDVSGKKPRLIVPSKKADVIRKEIIYNYHFDEEGKTLYLRTDDGKLSSVNFKTGRIKRGLKDRKKLFPEPIPSHDYLYSQHTRFGRVFQTRILYASKDTVYFSIALNTVKFYLGSDTITLEFQEENQWLLKNNKGDYDCQRKMEKQLYAVSKELNTGSRPASPNSRLLVDFFKVPLE